MFSLTLEGQIGDLEALVSALGSGDNGGVADQRVVDTGVWDQVGLELVQVDVQGAIEPQRRGNRGDNLGNQAVQMLVTRAGNVQIPAADVVHGLVVNKKGAIRVLDSAVSREDGIVRLNNSRREAWRRVDGEFKLALLAIVGREALKKESTKTGPRTATKGVEDKETLKRLAVIYISALAMRLPNGQSRQQRAYRQHGGCDR